MLIVSRHKFYSGLLIAFHIDATALKISISTIKRIFDEYLLDQFQYASTFYLVQKYVGDHQYLINQVKLSIISSFLNQYTQWSMICFSLWLYHLIFMKLRFQKVFTLKHCIYYFFLFYFIVIFLYSKYDHNRSTKCSLPQYPPESFN